MYGGLLSFLQYLEKIDLKETLAPLNEFKKTNAIYSVADIITHLVPGWAADCSRLYHFDFLFQDALFQSLNGGKSPHYSLLSEDLIRLAQVDCKLSEKLNTFR